MTTTLRRHWPLTAPVALAAVLNSWALGTVGWGNQYYAAAARSMSQSWHAFVFGAFDAEGFVTVDKPPFSLWVQAAVVKVFGFHPLSLLVPQVVAGCATVVLVYATIVRRWGRLAATVGATTMAIAPINVMVNHSNNTDAILTFTMTATVAAGVRAAETGRARWLLVAAVAFGASFTTKMLAAFPVLPAILLSFALAAPLSPHAAGAHVGRRRRTAALAGGAALACVSALAWFVYVDLTPEADRPYVGSSPTNSAFQLAFDRNGLGQVEGQAPTGPGGTDRPAIAPGQPPPGQPPPGQPPSGQAGPAPPRPGQPGPGQGFAGGEPGLLRLFNADLGTQIGWLVVPGLVGAVAAVGLTRRRAWRTPSLVAPVTWFAVGAAGYSITKGIVHPYYVASIGPPLAMLAGVGAGALRRRADRRPWWLAAAAAVTLAGGVDWVISRRSGYDLTTILAVVTALGGVGAVAWASATRHRPHPLVAAAFASAALVVPSVWTMGSLKAGMNAGIPYADPTTTARAGPGGAAPDDGALISFLVANRGDAQWLVATPSAMVAAPLIIETGEAVMAMGGFSGGDPILDAGEFDLLVTGGRLRYVLLGRADRPAQGANSPIARHVRASCSPVAGVPGELYDCRRAE